MIQQLNYYTCPVSDALVEIFISSFGCDALWFQTNEQMKELSSFEQLDMSSVNFSAKLNGLVIWVSVPISVLNTKTYVLIPNSDKWINESLKNRFLYFFISFKVNVKDIFKVHLIYAFVLNPQKIIRVRMLPCPATWSESTVLSRSPFYKTFQVLSPSGSHRECTWWLVSFLKGKGMFYLQGMSSWEMMKLLVLLLVFCWMACVEGDEGKAEPPG